MGDRGKFPAVTDGDRFLCLGCRAIDLDDIFSHPDEIPAQGRPIVKLGQITANSENSTCHLCRLFAATRISREESPEFHLRAFSCLTKRGIRMTKLRVSQKPSIVLAIVPGPSRKTLHGLRSVCLSNGLITRQTLAETVEAGP
jgi:hypothetical protein